MKRICLLFYCIGFCLVAVAQSHNFRFLPLKDLALPYQALAGNIGSHFFMYNRLGTGTDGLDLFVYDTVSQNGNRRSYRFPRQVSSVFMREKSIVFTGLARTLKGINVHYLELDQNGDTLQTKVHILESLSSILTTMTSPDRQHLLFYQFFRRGVDSALIQGMVLGVDGEIKKTLSYTFKHDKERDDEPQTFIDNNGNTQVVVYDKYNNYRLSTDITVNTILQGEEAMISETFAVQKTKLKSMSIFQNPSCNCLQAQGLYADGMTKDVRGMYTLSFPSLRQNQLRQKFSAFTPEMLKSFKKGFNATDAGICNSLVLQDITQTDSGTNIIFRLNAEVVAQVERGGRTPRISRTTIDAMNGYSMITTRANQWNAPKTVYLKMTKEQDFDWHVVRGLDVFRFSDAKYNRVLHNSDGHEILTILTTGDRSEEPQPLLVSVKDGKQVAEKLSEKFVTFTQFQSLSKRLYGTIYLNPQTSEGGILLIQPSVP